MIYHTSLLSLQFAVTAILKSMKVDTISPKCFVIFEESELQVGPY